LPRPTDRSTVPDDPTDLDDVILDAGRVVHPPRRALLDLPALEPHGHRMGRLLFLHVATYRLAGERGTVEAHRVWREAAA